MTLISFLQVQILHANPDPLGALNQSTAAKPVAEASPEPTPLPSDNPSESFFLASPISKAAQAVEAVPPGGRIIYGVDGRIDRYQFADGSSIQYLDEDLFSIRILSADGDPLEEITVPEPPVLDLSRAIRVTLENGLDAYYIDGKPVEFRTQTGVRITNLVSNDQNGMMDALVVEPHGKRDVIRNNVTIRSIENRFITDFLPDGRVVREIRGGDVLWYTYTEDDFGKVTGTRVLGPNNSQVNYDELGLLRGVLEFGEGYSTKKHLEYDRKNLGGFYYLILREKTAVGVEEKTPRWIAVDKTGELLRMRLVDGTFIHFKNGQAARVRDRDGKVINDYEPLLEHGFLQGLTVRNQWVQYQYNAQGFLDKITTPQGTVHRQAQDTNADAEITDEEIELKFELPDGTWLLPLPENPQALMLDPEGKILNGILKTKEGIGARIVNGKQTGYETLDGRFYERDGDQFKLSRWVFQSEQGQAVAQYNTDADIVNLQEILFPDRYKLHQIRQADSGAITAYIEESLNPSQDGWKERHFEAGRLVKLVTPEDAEIFYDATGMADKFILKEGEDTVEYAITYHRSADGSLENVTFQSPSSSYSFNPEGELLRLLSHGFFAEFEQGSVKRLLSRFAAVENPQWPEGKFNGEVEFHDGAREVIQNGDLVKTILPGGKATIHYQDGRIEKIETPLGLYRLVYEEGLGKGLRNVRIRLESKEGQPEYPLVSFLSHPDWFIDDPQSEPVHVLEFNGDAMIVEEWAKIGNGAVRLDGEGDYLTLADFGEGEIGTGDFTVDFWVKMDTHTQEKHLFKLGEGNNLYLTWHTVNGGRLDLIVGGGVQSTAYPIDPGQWHHFAIVRESGMVKLFVDGVQTNSAFRADGAIGGGVLLIGTHPTGILGVHGWLDEFRISKGVARWGSNFALPEKPYEQDEFTTLLLSFDIPTKEPTAMEREAQELSRILLGRPLQNAFEDRFVIESELVTGETLFFAHLTQDTDREDTYQIAGNYFPQWENVSFQGDLDQGFIARSVDLGNGSFAEMTSALLDINGDSLLDRAFMKRGRDYWWVQLGNGQGFEDPVPWPGVWHDSDAAGSLRFFDSSSPYVYGDLVDMTGDGRPERVFKKPGNESTWYVQINTGYGFGDPLEWDTGIDFVTNGIDNAKYALRVWDDTDANQPLIADLVDLDGDGLKDRVFRPGTEPYTHWFWQRNLGDGFDDTLVWGGVDTSFHSDARTGSSLSWYERVANNKEHPLARSLEAWAANYTRILQTVILERDYDEDLWGWNENATPPDWLSLRFGEPEMDQIVQAIVSAFIYSILRQKYGPPAYEPDEPVNFFDPAAYPLSIFPGIRPSDIADLMSDGLEEYGFVEDSFDDMARIDFIEEFVNQAKISLGRLFAAHPRLSHLKEWIFLNESGIWDVLNWAREFNPAPVAKNIVRALNELVAEVSNLVDINGDGLLDRMVLKETNQTGADLAFEWYVQLNHGDGFQPATLWDSSIRILPESPHALAGGSLGLMRGWEGSRDVLIDLVDVTGDGLPDRVSVDRNDYESQAQGTWWVEVNTGVACGSDGAGESCGFKPAVAWTGIEGQDGRETAISQEDGHFRNWAGGRGPVGFVKKVTELRDMNADSIPDRVIFRQSEGKWFVQFGTGRGFLPVKEFQIQGLKAPAKGFNTSRYDYLHVSLKAKGDGVPAGRVEVRLLGEEGQVTQSWVVEDITSLWQEFYLPIVKTKPNASVIKIESIPQTGESVPEILVEDLTFLSLRPPAAKDWLDRMLTEEAVLSEIHSERTKTLQDMLGFKDAQGPMAFDWQKLLEVPSVIHFDPKTQEIDQFRTLYGSVSEVKDGVVTKTKLPNETVITFESDPANPQKTTQDVTLPQGQGTQSVALEYGRIRSVTKPGENPLEYSYEFLADGTEVTVVKDTVTGKIERNINGRLIQRQDPDGVVTDYEYNEKGELIRSVVSYKGKALHTFEHSISSQGNKIIKTQEGVVEEYSPEGSILFHTTPEGYRYEHSFEQARKVVTSETVETVDLPDNSKVSVKIPYVRLEPDPEGEELHAVTLRGYDSGSESAEYGEIELVAEGRETRKVLGLTSVVLPDETIGQKTILKFSRMQELEETDEETGQVTRSLKPLDGVVLHHDGTVTEFKDGKPYLVKTASGREISLETDPGMDLLINPAESAQFHYDQAKAFWDATVIPSWERFQAPPTLPIRMEYTKDEGKLVTREFAEGVTELYNESGKIQEVLGREGERLIHYSYDSEGNPTHIDMEGARRRLESSVLKVQAQLALERLEALERVEERKQVLDQQIEASYLEAKQKLLAMLSQIQAAKNQIANIPARGKKARNMIRDAWLEVENAERQVNQALVDLETQYREALAKLDEEVAKAKGSIETQTKDITDQITLESQNAQRAILMQEISPIVSHWHRKLLGRDPSQAEYDAIIAKTDYKSGTFDLEGLKTRLSNSAESRERAAQVQAIKDEVDAALMNSFTLSEGSKESWVKNLGIEKEYLVNLSEAEATAIVKWLKERTLHFGQSAYLALEALLTQAGIRFDRVQLAKRLILIDILTGTITPMEQGDLVISMYALRKAGEHYGLKASNYKMTYEVLKAMYRDAVRSTPDAVRIIAHINGNHYVILTGIEVRTKTEKRPRYNEDGTLMRNQDGNILFEEVALLDDAGNPVTEEIIRYIDPGAGPEDALSEVTLTKEEFLRTWIDPRRPDDGFGYVLSARPPPDTLSGQYSLLSISQEQSIRGAFFAFLIAIFVAIVKAVVEVVIAVVVAVKELVIALVKGMAEIFRGFAGFFKELFTGDILGAFKAGFGSLWKGLGIIGNGFQTAFGAVHGALLAGIQGIAETIPLFGPVLSTFTQTSAFANALKLSLIGLTLDGTGKLLEKLGLSPKIIQTLYAGGKILIGIGMLARGDPMGIATAIGLTTGGVTELLSLHTSLSPFVANVISIGVSAFTAFATGYFSSDLKGINLLKASAPYLLADLASAGLSELGTHLGLDPRLTALINVPIRATVRGLTTTLVNPNGGGGPGDIFKGIKDALFSQETLTGFINVGASVLEDATGIPAIVTAAGFAAITGGIQGVLRNQGFFKGAAQAYRQSVLEVLSLTAGQEDPSDPNLKFRQLARIGRVLNFASVIQQKGLLAALETYAASIFTDQGMEAIFERGGIADFISGEAKAVKISNRDLIEIKVGNQDFIYLEPETENLEIIRKGNTLIYGEFGVDENGSFGLINGYYEQRLLVDQVLRLEIENGLLKEAQIDVGGLRRFTAYPLLNGGALQVNPDGSIQNGLLWDHQVGVLYVVREGLIIEYGVKLLKSPLSQPSFDDVLQSMLEEANRKGIPKEHWQVLEAGSKQMYTNGKYIPSTEVIGFEGTVTNVTPEGFVVEMKTREGMHVLDGKSFNFYGNKNTVGKGSISSGVTYNAANPEVSGSLQLSAGVETKGIVFGSGKVYLEVKGKIEQVSQIEADDIASAAGGFGLQTEARIDFLRTKVQSFYKLSTGTNKLSVVFRTQTINEMTGALSERELSVSFDRKDSMKSYAPSVSANLMLLGDIINGKHSILTDEERDGLKEFISGELRATGPDYDEGTIGRLSDDLLSILPDMAQEAKFEMPALLAMTELTPDFRDIAIDSGLSVQEIKQMQAWWEKQRSLLTAQQR